MANLEQICVGDFCADIPSGGGGGSSFGTATCAHVQIGTDEWDYPIYEIQVTMQGLTDSDAYIASGVNDFVEPAVVSWIDHTGGPGGNMELSAMGTHGFSQTGATIIESIRATIDFYMWDPNGQYPYEPYFSVRLYRTYSGGVWSDWAGN